jgi:hypothetical protein
MGFVIKHDYHQLITLDDLNTIIDNDDHILDESMLSTQREMESYLRGRFAVDKMFLDVTEYQIATEYLVGTIVVLTAESWKNQQYTIGQLVSFDVGGVKSVYRCIQDTTTKQIPTDSVYWRKIGQTDQLYTVLQTASNVDPKNVDFYEPRDARDPHLIRMFIDLLLYEIHSRISPRNIPEFRIQRHDDVISYLKNVSDPRKNINPSFPTNEQPENEGFDISFGSAKNKSNHSY